MENQTKTKIDHLFRNEYVKLISFLTAKFGLQCIDAIEDGVQEALLKAMHIWSFNDLPSDPHKWLYRVAHNEILDTLRRQQKSVLFDPNLGMLSSVQETDMDYELQDEQLKMIFACCHSELSEKDQIMLSLKLLCGFSTNEIARVLLKTPDAIKKGLSRAKKRFKTINPSLVIPAEEDLSSRMESVLHVIYLIFTNGYTAYTGSHLLKKDVCEDAMRMAGLLSEHPRCNTPELCALVALMSYNLSRFEARVSPEEELVLLKDQNRSLWDQELIALGNKYFNYSMKIPSYSKYHLEAAIAQLYATSSCYKEIDWVAILKIYDVLVSKYKDATLALNRLVVLAKVDGNQIALDELNQLKDPSLFHNHHYYSIKGDFEKKLSMNSYKGNIKKAIALTNNEKEQKHLRSKL